MAAGVPDNAASEGKLCLHVEGVFMMMAEHNAPAVKTSETRSIFVFYWVVKILLVRTIG